MMKFKCHYISNHVLCNQDVKPFTGPNEEGFIWTDEIHPLDVFEWKLIFRNTYKQLDFTVLDIVKVIGFPILITDKFLIYIFQTKLPSKVCCLNLEDFENARFRPYMAEWGMRSDIFEIVPYKDIDIGGM